MVWLPTALLVFETVIVAVPSEPVTDGFWEKPAPPFDVQATGWLARRLPAESRTVTVTLVPDPMTLASLKIRLGAIVTVAGVERAVPLAAVTTGNTTTVAN